MGSLPSRFRLSTLTNYLNTATAIVVALVITPVLVHGLGKVEYGIWVLVASTVLYLDLFNLGLGRATVKYVAELTAKGDEEGVRRAVVTAAAVLAIPGALALVAGVGLAFAFPVLFAVPHALRGSATLLVILIAVDLAISIPGDVFGGVLIARQRYDLLNATLIVVTVCQAIAWTVLLALGHGLVALGVATVALSLVGQLARVVLARRLIGGLVLSRALFDRSFVRPLAGMSGWISLAELAELVIARTDTIVVGLVVGIEEAAVYAVAQKLALLAGRAMYPVTQAFFPHAAHLFGKGDTAGLRSLFTRGTQVAVAIAVPVALTLVVLAGPALTAWVGPSFASGAWVVALLASATAVTSITHTAVYVLRGTGDVKPAGIAAAAEAALNLALSITLGLAFGMKGVALATLVAAVVLHLVFLFPYAARRLRVPARPVVLQLARAHLLPSAAALGVGLALRRADLGNLAAVAGAGAAMMVTYGLVFAMTGLDSGTRHSLAGRLRP